jgi:hypothetical protein
MAYGVIAWNGRAWSDTGFPESEDQLSGLDCVNASWCMAVSDPGQDIGNGGQAQSVIWDGHTWTTQDIGALSVPGDTPFSLSCPTTTFCMTTTNTEGEIMDSALSATQDNVSYRWNGTTWTEVTWPAQSVSVWSLSCSSPTSCVQLASPNQGTSGYGQGDVAFTWNGNTWSERSAPLPGSIAAVAMSCNTSGICLATGNQTEVGDAVGTSAPTVVDMWDGWQWQAVPWPSDAADAILSGVSCTNSSICAVAGPVAATLPI